MNEGIKQEWVKRLRSGLYKQGTCSLRSASDEYCCLGVLCEIAVENDVVQRMLKYDIYTYGAFEDDRDYSVAFLPAKVVEWSGMKTADGAYNQGRDMLTYDNDMAGKDFNEIADIIEEWF